MPNGGSDCCGTCWFNRANRGRAGHVQADPPIAPHCEIRDFAIEVPFYTYCANHPKRRLDRDPIPIGPVSVDHGRGREIERPSPDTPAVREHLLSLLAGITEQPLPQYPIGGQLEDVIVWQLGEFGEARSVAGMERILQFNPKAASSGVFSRPRAELQDTARSALAKIRAGG
jgi:hypothetical protein